VKNLLAWSHAPGAGEQRASLAWGLSCAWFRPEGFGLRVSGFGFWVPVSDLGVLASGVGFRESTRGPDDVGFRVQVVGFEGNGLLWCLVSG